MLLFFFGENNEWIKKFYLEEMCGLKCSILIYLFIKLEKLFSNFHFDQVDNTFTCFRERGEFYDPGAQL